MQNNDNGVIEYTIPTELEKNKLLMETHEIMGHTGYMRLVYEIKNIKKIYWKNIINDCKNFVEECSVCLFLFNFKYQNIFKKLNI